MPLQKGVQNNVSKFNPIDYKISMFKKAMYAHVGVYTYTPNSFSMTLHFLFLAFFPFHSILRIVKNYTLSIFMLSGSIQFSI